jgi:hypothetical protein
MICSTFGARRSASAFETAAGLSVQALWGERAWERFPRTIVLPELKPEEISAMPKQAHTEAATHHENAAKSHRSAAEHHGKDDAMSSKHSGEALSHSEKAHEASKNAHSKSSGKK